MSERPPCGLYRTTRAIGPVAAQRLVYFHNHSEQGDPIILTPHANEHNRWAFHDKGTLVSDPEDVQSLVHLRSEGIYRLREHFHAGSRIVPKEALAQLGYNAQGEAILFFPQPNPGTNGFVFPERGMKINDETAELLAPLNIRGPSPEKSLH